jgi:putative pyruvate formate lyase activating enzyme
MLASNKSSAGPGERFILDPFEPAYMALLRSGDLQGRAEAALKELESCSACPRECGVNRTEGETAVCRTARHARVSSAFPHRGEEDCLRGRRGSGTIFFSMCNLQCVFCQNFDLSQHPIGEESTATEIAALMIDLQDQGCHNINFVTPEHVAPQVIEAIVEAVPRGLRLPIVYNTSAYDAIPTLKLLDGLVDIYMPDFKIWDPAKAKRLLRAEDYPERAREAVGEMHRQVGPLRFGPDGTARRGVLVRHLVMPGMGEDSAAIFRWLAEACSPDTFVNIMAQYHPDNRVGKPDRQGRLQFEEISRGLRVAELEHAYRSALEAGLWRFDERL